MEKEAFNQYVENRYQKQMDFYKSSSAKNQARYKYFQWVLIILSALTPVLAAMDWEKIAVVIVSSIVAILTTGLKTFQYQELWVNYRATYEQLKPEIHYFTFSVGPYGASGIDKESLFVTRIEAILDKEHQGWPPAKKIRDDRNPGENSVTQPANSENKTNGVAEIGNEEGK
jgi:hypothetical protein